MGNWKSWNQLLWKFQSIRSDIKVDKHTLEKFIHYLQQGGVLVLFVHVCMCVFPCGQDYIKTTVGFHSNFHKW